jgi:Flp pilus assembly protein TadG
MRPFVRASMKRLIASENGNVAIIFAMAVIPLLVTVGASIDYSRAAATRVALQSALDSTALMLAKEAATETSAQLQSNAAKYFNAQFSRSGIENIQVSATYKTSGGPQVTVSANAQQPTTIMKLLGYKMLPVGSSSTTTWGTGRLRVALVLDNTGSMATANKLTALKTAAQNLLSQLRSAASVNGDVYVSIIPFVKDVNVGSSNYNASWIDWTDWDEYNGSCSKKQQTTKSSCLGASGKPTWTPDSHSSWNGCVTDRGAPLSTGATGPSSGDYDTNVTAPSTSIAATLYAAEQYASCPTAAVMGLSYDWPSMNTLVNNMTANGSTNQAIGLQLGWMSLTGGGPFTMPAKDPSYTYQQVIILLTDGLNTQNRWYTSDSSIDSRQKITCENVKAAGITLYTIQVNTDGDPTSTLLQNCASSSDKFFLLTSADQILTVLSSIGTKLSEVYLSN